MSDEKNRIAMLEKLKTDRERVLKEISGNSRIMMTMTNC